MTHASAPPGETFGIVQKLKELFSNTTNREQLEKIIPNLDSVQSLLSELPDMIIKYERQDDKIDQQTDFLEQLNEFKKRVEEIINKSIQDPERLVLIDHYISAIRLSYELFLAYGQTLEEINEIIAIKVKHNPTENKKEISTLIVRGIDKKIPNKIYFDKRNPNDIKKKLQIIEQFYGYFIEYILYIRESLDIMLNDNNYRLELERLQSKLLKMEPSNIKEYFAKIKSKMMKDQGYSTEILLEYLAKNTRIHISISNNSKFYCKHFIEMFQNLLSKKCIELLSDLTFKLNDKSDNELKTSPFLYLFKEVNKNDLVFKSIYDKGIDLYSKLKNDSSTTAKDTGEQLKTKFKNTIVDENNSVGSHLILGDIYGQRIKNLDFSDKNINVKYCFNYYFFKSLSYFKLDDNNSLSQFNRLLFYIHTCVDQDTLEFAGNKHEEQLLELKRHFSNVYNIDNRTHFDELVEIFKVMINIESFKFRLERVKSSISKLEKGDKINIKATVLKEFLDLNTYGSEICLRLAQSFNIDLIKYIPDGNDKILSRLCGYNSNFHSLINRLQKSRIQFDIDRELTPGFSIPYYLSAMLANDSKFNHQDTDNKEEIMDSSSVESDNITNPERAATADSHRNKKKQEETNEIVMSILFKVFTCSTDNDKEVFLKNKNSIHQEFNKLYESVKRLIAFYNASDDININEKLRDRSIQHILDGFSRTNQESLSKRNEYARVIIDNFINYTLNQINQIVESTKSETEVLNLFDIFMKRNVCDTLECWTKNTSELRDKIYFLYCYHHYKETDFDEWYQKSNSNQSYTIIQNNREKIKQDFHIYNKAFELIKIKYLQHNQVGALALIHDYLSKPFETSGNLFIKIGTGQGKSLTIAETARRIVKNNPNASNPKVFVITCYDHLAKRDHENYEKYYKYFNIETMYCSSNSSSEEFGSKDVIYADLETYFCLLRKEGYNRLIHGTSIKLPNIKNAVLIMDEFDSLILDSDELLQYIYNFEVHIKNPNANFDRKEDVEQLFDKEFIEKCNSKFSNIFDRWWNSKLSRKKTEDNNEHRKTTQDSLGKNSTFAQSLLNYLKYNKRAHFVHYYMDPLVFYSQFKQVIGFSGSIEPQHLNKFQRLFNNKTPHYYNIPPFFGETNLKQNRTFSNDPGKVYENTHDFLYAIKEEIEQKYKNQPILIFADSYKKENGDQSDYEQIRDKLLEAQKTFLNDRKIIEIQSEDAIAENIHKIGKLDSITLATRIIGRGADIKVDKSIEKGLHLLLTYYPTRENIFTQMLGRTARQDEKGSYSIIVRKDKQFATIQEIAVNSRNKTIHELTEYFYRNYTPRSNNSDVALKWALFSELIQTFSVEDIQEHSLETLQEFVSKTIL
ncbi:hypothetical protein I4U23_024160 [Adineta vaga]|nr:hypothetical protein I4U23_024160 [Adineta vaga]